ncbi:hypothetical protein LZF95_21020 [Algoriphagus sp. AGSA1]|uniref:hypothetical protein n=1 Tax=Algoriphagus sp. AGSA1 TaxID=2907213 RepID=UPI001F2E23CF|nr:hypothetical protein [Algoriphagus sp. AGSA1]MCE7057176.1 hypothetical protein [Algoriphagus sp. AGSA1]
MTTKLLFSLTLLLIGLNGYGQSNLQKIPAEKEELGNGVNRSAMTQKLLEKVEELTVYLVEQNSKIKALENELNDLRIKQ